MKSLLALSVIVPFAFCVTACGGTDKGAHSISSTQRHFLNDGDAEKISDHDGDNSTADNEDTDADSSEEYETTDGNSDYHDSDDSGILNSGHAASVAETRAVTAVVKRYYAAAAVGDGARVCSMMTSAFAHAVPESYGNGNGVAYLRAGKTCQAVMSLLFKHFHRQLTDPITVTGVRLNGSQALAFLGSSMLPATSITLVQEDGIWRVVALLGQAMP